MTFWAIFLSWGIILGSSVKHISILLWPLSFLLALIGAYTILMKSGKKEDGYTLQSSGYSSLLAAALVPTILMAAYFLHGINSYMGSWFWDGWSYIAQGQYLWQHSFSSQETLAPLYQYASGVKNGRFISCALISFFSPLTGSLGDTQASSGIFLAWAIFVFSSSSMFFATKTRSMLHNKFQILYILVTVFSGWLLNILIANNYDNLLAISFLPVFAGILTSINLGDKKWALILGTLAAGSLNVYPEMFPIDILCISFFIFQHLLKRKEGELKKWLFLILFSIIITIFLIAPVLKPIILLIGNHLKAGLSSGCPPGAGYFPGLLHAYSFPGSFWGFWAPFENCNQTILKLLSSIISLPITFLFFLGFFDLFKRREWGIILTMMLLLCATLAMIFIWSYDYGAYKFISLNWWATSFTVILGAIYLQGRCRNQNNAAIIKISLQILFSLVLVLVTMKIINFHMSVNPKDIAEYKKVEEINKITKNELLLLNIKNPKTLEWAIYYLRNTPIYIVHGDLPYFPGEKLMQGIKGIKPIVDIC